MNRYDVKSIIDLSFWDNPQTRTGYPGWSGKGGSGGVKELLVGHAYRFKNVIDFSKFNWDDSKAEDAGGGLMQIPFGKLGRSAMSVCKIMSDSVNALTIGIGNDFSTYYSFAYASNVPEEIPYPENTGLNADSRQEVSAPVIVISENECDTDYNDLTMFFEEEVTDAPIIMIGGAAPIYLTKKYNTWEELINTDVEIDHDACYSNLYSGYFKDRGDGYLGWGGNYAAYVVHDGNDVRITDEIIYMNPDAYDTIE